MRLAIFASALLLAWCWWVSGFAASSYALKFVLDYVGCLAWFSVVIPKWTKRI